MTRPRPPEGFVRTADGSGVESFLGDAYEISVKRGLLAALAERGLLPREHPALDALSRLSIAGIAAHIRARLAVTDDAYADWIRGSIARIAYAGFFYGSTAGRQLLGKLADGASTEALWCPVDLPDRDDPIRHERDVDAVLDEFWRRFGLPGTPSQTYAAKGGPARADWLLLARTPDGRHVLVCVEVSLHAEAAFADWTRQDAHLDELAAWVARVERRGVFSHLSAEIAAGGDRMDDRVRVGAGLMGHLGAFTGRDKPLFKLCQASAYATRFARGLRQMGSVPGDLRVIATALTSGGIEAAQADLPADSDPEQALAPLLTLAGGYHRTLRGASAEGFADEGAAVLEHLKRALPPALRVGLDAALHPEGIGRDFEVRLHEEVTGFVNPAGPVPVGSAADGVRDDEAMHDVFGGSGRDALVAALGGAHGPAPALRDIHGAAVRAALSAARPGRLQVLALEGNPGIGKTTAVRDWLAGLGGGWLFIYLSPRVLINGDVTREMAKLRAAGGVLTLTTNATLISGAAEWYAGRPDRDPARVVQAAVRYEGEPAVAFPASSSTIALGTDQADTVEADFGGSGARTRDLDIRTREAIAGHNPGVLATLASYARDTIAANPELRSVVLAAAIQGYRLTHRGTTIAALDALFRHRPGDRRGIREREAFARRFPRVVVMVDEIAGDPAGAPLVHDLAAWMRRHFTDDLGPDRAPQAALVVADASLGNEAVFARYLLSQDEAPQRVLISPGRRGMPFRMTAAPSRIGGALAPLSPVLHVMTDSFPAGRLEVEYVVSFDRVEPPPDEDGPPARPFRLIEDVAGERRLTRACREISRALDEGAGQVIFFAQNKAFLRDLRAALTDPAAGRGPGGAPLDPTSVAVIDSSVPERRRRHLIRPEIRDGLRVVLMTSSGARGINFPLATRIIASVPRFSIESGLMEIVQLIYRGRGKDATGTPRDGLDRRLTLLLEDFVLAERHEGRGEPEFRRRWLRQATDVATFLLLLRGCMFTRITGDAGIPGRRLAIVPVGRIGVDQIERTMSESLRVFLSEAEAAVRDGGLTRRQIGSVVNARDGLSRRMSDVEMRVRRHVSNPASGLTRWMTEMHGVLSDHDLGLDALIRTPPLPANAYAVGPLWFEDCSDGALTETLISEAEDDADGSARRDLLSRLWAIEKDRGLPGKLRQAARDLHRYLRPPDAAGPGGGFRTFMALRRGSFWALQPLDPTGVVAPTDRDRALGRRVAPVRQPEVWLSLLERAAGLHRDAALSFPVLPAFDERPFLVFSARGDVTGLRRGLDDSLFMASRELNLLNTILLDPG